MFLRLLQLCKKIPPAQSGSIILVVHDIPLNILAPKFLAIFQESQFVLDKTNRAQ